MDFLSASLIAKEQGLFLTTDLWFEEAERAAKAQPGKTVFMLCFHWTGTTWISGTFELPPSYKTRNSWRVYNREFIVVSACSH